MKDHFANYKKIYLPILITALILILGFLLIVGFINGSISNFLNKFFKCIAPITTGFIIAYLSNPFVIFFEKHIFKWISSFKVRRFFSILTTMILLLLFIAIILVILVPSLIDTLISFWNTYVVNYEDSIRKLVVTINDSMDKFKIFKSIDRLNPESTIAWIQSKIHWLDDVATGDLESILPNVSSSISKNISAILEYALSLGTSVFNFLKNFFLGIFIAFYMLMSKEKAKAYIRRLLNCFLSPKKVRSVVRFGKLVDRSFGGFIEGQLLDAIVVGFISYFVFAIFGIPIPHLLATIIAITNIIPILGPFIGGIPAAFIVLLTAPNKTILFVLLIVIIQQIDGNIICPHIIGDKIHISSLATITAIITMGGLFGILGMIIGVPIFAVIIHMINDYSMNALRKKGLPTTLKDYYVGNPESIENNSSSFKIKLKLLFKKSNKKDENNNIQEK